MGSVAVLIGLVAMYVGKIEGLSVKNAAAKSKDTEKDQENEQKGKDQTEKN